MNRILCAMSGGVDSAAAALLLKEKGYDVTGVTMRLSDNESDITDAKNVCDIIGINHIALDFRDEFVKLVERPFCESYLKGETPNPCIICNKTVKFGLLLDYANSNGFDMIATGHYVGKTTVDGHTVITRAADETKDQSYMLWQLSEEQIARTEFPLAELHKDRIRQMTKDHNFPNSDKHDSQDICFIPDGDYVSFIGKLTGYVPNVGDYLDVSGKVIGHHKGQLHYTVGQRKGLGIGFGEHRYVLSKNAENNTVTLGTDEQLYSKELTVKSINLSAVAVLPAVYNVKIRYAHKAQPAYVERIGDDRMKITFNEPQRAPAKGQSAVLYKDGILVGGGFIE